MNSKMVVRILSISVALLFLGMVAPCLAFDATTPTSLDFGEVTVETTESATLTIHNPNPSYTMTVTLSVVNGEYGECGFSVEPAQLTLEPNGSGDATVWYAPTAEGYCEADISVYYGRGNPILVQAKGTGLPAAPSTVIIDGQDTGVENVFYNDKAMSVWLDDCAGAARNHGEYVRCVALLTRNMKKAKLLNGEQRGAIIKAAAHANIPPRKSGLEELSHEGTPVTDLIKACEENAGNNKEYMRCVYQLMKEMKKAGELKTRKEKHQIRRYAAKLRFHSRHHK